MPDAPPTAERPKRRWYQFSLRTLLIVVTLLAIPFGWLGIKLRDSRIQKNVVDAILEQHGWVEYDYQLNSQGHLLATAEIPGAAWMRSLLGDDFFRTVRVVIISDRSTLSELRLLEKLPRLEFLFMSNTKVKDSDLKHLRGLNLLARLDLYDTSITDSGLEHLQGLTQLKQLSLHDTSVTKAGVTKLRAALPNCDIAWPGAFFKS